MTGAERAAAVAGRKTQHRVRADVPGLSRLSAGDWETIDWAAVHWANSVLNVRVGPPEDRRTASIECKAYPYDLGWARTPGLLRDDCPESLLLTRVWAHRLWDIEHADASRDLPLRELTKATKPSAAYDDLISKLGRTQRSYWNQREGTIVARQNHPLPRDLFSVYWEFKYGMRSYDRNPWVWAFEFELIRTPIAGAVKIYRSKKLRPRKLG